MRELPALPDPELYADVGYAPATPTGAAQLLDAAACAEATALHLRLLAELVQRLGAARLGLDALWSSSGGEAVPGPAGAVRIEELYADVPSARLPVALVLAAATYGADARLQRPWAAGDAAAAAQQLLGALAQLAEQQSATAGQAPEAHGQGGHTFLMQEVSTTKSHPDSARQALQQQQPAAVQRLLALALPAAFQQLRPVVAAKAEHSRHSTARLEPYRGACRLQGHGLQCVHPMPAAVAGSAGPQSGCCQLLCNSKQRCNHTPPPLRPAGPGNFERCVAAGQLAWLVWQLSGRALGGATAAALPLVLATAEDPFPPAHACGLWALEHMAAAGQPEDLR